MMELITTITGNYPKISELKGEVNLRRVLNRFDAGKASEADVEQAFKDTIARVITEQESAGLDWVTDGRIRWDDPVTPLAKNCRGIKIGGLIRFFDNNVYYRRPVITGPPTLDSPTVASDYKYAVSIAKKSVMPAIVGPYSFARLSKDEYFKDVGRCTQALAEILNHELDALEKAGAEWVQVDEPSLGFFPEDMDIARRAWETMCAGRSIKKILYTYFGDITPLADTLFSFPAEVIGADVITRPGNFECLLQAPEEQGLMFGLLDARNTKLEDVDDLRDKLERITAARKTDCWLAPSCALEFLPHKNAVAKMNHLTEAVAKAGVAL